MIVHDVIKAPANDSFDVLVLTRLKDWESTGFDNFGEAVDFMSQALEARTFLARFCLDADSDSSGNSIHASERNGAQVSLMLLLSLCKLMLGRRDCHAYVLDDKYANGVSNHFIVETS
jgi:hypothetical protein